MNLKQIRDKARSLAKGACRVCPICDGRICAGEVPGMGGAGTGSSFRNNVAALNSILLYPRLIHSVHFPETSTRILGLDLSIPLMIAPIGGISFNVGAAMDEAEYQQAVTSGAIEAGIIAGTPDSAPDEVMKMGLAQAKKLGKGKIIPFIKPWEVELIQEKMEWCAKAGVEIVGCDLDSIGLITLRLMGKPAFAKSAEQLSDIVSKARALGLKIIIKGVMHPSDAEICAEAGVDAIVVSNHGGRVLDSAPATAAVLPLIREVVGGKLPILADGGIRSGVDILKMLALGADAVMIGRPYIIAAVGGGRQGVVLYTETLKAQLVQAMVMTGCRSIDEISSKALFAS
ncbi:MAG: alpha-hydroxy-acid oxidizing protein [Deltaproteobacteria bacterium]|jgi:isopentenyl diphosphate isomerase/L-lactate dehydrogenase-like FMN-dependent dehydrogenase|nr:alpha-hydroxy-acid oxidizing protein [Deltaproteobacteria bacterium]